MSVDREYRVKLVTEANASGIHETTDAFGKSGVAAKEAEGHTMKLGGAHRELHKLMHLVTEESPVLGLAMRAAFSPQGAAIMAVVMALRYLSQAEEEASKKASEAGEAAARTYEKPAQAINRIVDAIHNVDLSYAEWVTNAGRGNDDIAKDLDKVIGKMMQEAGILKELLKLQGKGTAGVDSASTDISLSLTTQALEKARRDLQAAREEASQKGFAESEAQRLDPEGAKKNAEAAAETAKAAKEKQSKAEDAQREAELGVRFPSASNVALDALSFPGMKPAGDARAQKELQEKTSAAEQAATEAELASRRAKQADDESKRVEAQKDAAIRAAREAEKHVQELQAQVDHLTGQHAKLTTEAAGQGLTDSRFGYGPTLSSGAAALQTLQDHKGKISELDQGSIDAIRELTTFLNKAGALNATMVSLIRSKAGDVEALAAQLKVLEGRLMMSPATRSLPGGG